MTANSYTPPVSQLLSLGEPTGNEHNAWRDYSALEITSDHVVELIRMATDDALNNGPQKSKIVWAPLHAWRALAQLRAVQAVKPLLSQFHRLDAEMDDWLASDLPKALAKIGEAALGPASDYLGNVAHGEWARVTAAETLGEIGKSHPDLRADCVSRLANQLEKFSEQPKQVSTFIVSTLVDLRAVEAAPVIERAFAAGRVDESVQGDWEDVQIHFGLKQQREHPRKPNSLSELSEQLAKTREEIEAYERENAELRDTIELMQKIAPSETLDESDFDLPEPYLAPPKIGRNEPCPCGSGKKYKKCCGA